MAIDFGKVASYAHKIGIYDIDQAIKLLQEGKLPAEKVKALEDVMAYAKSNGIKDFGAEAENYFKSLRPDDKRAVYMRHALLNNMTPIQAKIDLLKTQNKEILDAKEAAAPLGEQGKSLISEFLKEKQEDRAQRAQDIAKDERERKLTSLRDIGRGFYETPEYHRRYWKGVTDPKAAIEIDPFFGSDAFRENIAKYSPAAITHREDLLNALNKSDFYNRVENLGRTQLPERQLYNNMLQQYQYEQARRNPLNILTGSYEYLRPAAYGQEASWVQNLRNRLGFSPVTNFNQ